MKLDPLDKTVSIPIRIVDGVPKPLYGGEWSSLREKAVGTLTLPAYAVRERDAVLLNAPLGIPLLKKGTHLYLAMSATKNRDNLVRDPPKPLEGQFKSGYALLVLLEELRLELRGTKSARLASVECDLPDLNLQASSVNEAYSRASEHFEPERRSHTGNVFELAFYLDRADKDHPGLRPLRALREAKEQVLEARFQVEHKTAKKE